MSDLWFAVGLALLMICAFFGGLFIGDANARSRAVLRDDDRNDNTRYIP